MTISNSGKDERGKYSGGVAGDQTGTEWQIRSWYNRPWKCVLRHPDPKVRAEIVTLATRAANNNKIGYDQSQRTTFWQQLEKVGYDPAKITVACESDCSAGVAAIVKAVGYRLGIDKLKNVSKDAYTGNLRVVLKAAGFEVLTDSKYLTSDKHLLAGDVLLNDSAHTAINLTNGSSGGSVPSSVTSTTTSGGFNVATLSTVQKGSKGAQVKSCQALLNAKNGAGLAVDGDAGSLTDAAIRNYQRKMGLAVDGQCGNNTWSALLTK